MADVVESLGTALAESATLEDATPSATAAQQQIIQAVARLCQVYTDGAGTIPSEPQNGRNIKQVFQLLHNVRALPGWFGDEPTVVAATQDVAMNAAGLRVVRGESLTVEVRFRYSSGALAGLWISEQGIGNSKDAAVRDAYVKVLLRLARDADCVVELSPDRLAALVARCISTRRGVPLTRADLRGGTRLPIDGESATVDFKSYVECKEIVRQVVGFLNGRDGFGLLVCGVRDATWEVCGVRDRSDELHQVNLETVVNSLDTVFANCNPPMQHGREYGVHVVSDIGICEGGVEGSVLLVEVHRPTPVRLLYKTHTNECYVRRGPQTVKLLGKDVYHVERVEAAHAWHTYWS